MTKISPSANSFFPVWDSSGNNVIWSFSPNLGYPYYILRKNLHSPHIDTIHNDYIGYNDVSRSNLLISEIAIGSDLFLGYSPLSAVSYTPIINLGYSTIRSISWHPNNEDFYYANYRVGIAKGNIFASTSQIILPNCGCVNYRIISCSPDGGS